MLKAATGSKLRNSAILIIIAVCFLCLGFAARQAFEKFGWLL